MSRIDGSRGSRSLAEFDAAPTKKKPATPMGRVPLKRTRSLNQLVRPVAEKSLLLTGRAAPQPIRVRLSEAFAEATFDSVMTPWLHRRGPWVVPDKADTLRALTVWLAAKTRDSATAALTECTYLTQCLDRLCKLENGLQALWDDAVAERNMSLMAVILQHCPEFIGQAGVLPWPMVQEALEHVHAGRMVTLDALKTYAQFCTLSHAGEFLAAVPWHLYPQSDAHAFLEQLGVRDEAATRARQTPSTALDATIEHTVKLHHRAYGSAQLPDGRVLVGGADGGIRMWNYKSDPAGSNYVDLRGHDGRVFAFCTLATGSFASASADGTVRLWQPQAAGANVYRSRIIFAPGCQIYAMLRLPNGTLLCGNADAAQIFTLTPDPLAPTGYVGDTFDMPAEVYSLSLMPSGRFLVGLMSGVVISGGVRADGHLECKAVASMRGGVAGLAALSDDSFVTGSTTGAVRLWQRANADAPYVAHELPNTDKVLDVVKLDDGRFITCGAGVRIWTRESASSTRCSFFDFRQHGDSVWSVLPLADGCFLSTSSDRTVRIWREPGLRKAVLGLPFSEAEARKAVHTAPPSCLPALARVATSEGFTALALAAHRAAAAQGTTVIQNSLDARLVLTHCAQNDLARVTLIEVLAEHGAATDEEVAEVWRHRLRTADPRLPAMSQRALYQTPHCQRATQTFMQDALQAGRFMDAVLLQQALPGALQGVTVTPRWQEGLQQAVDKLCRQPLADLDNERQRCVTLDDDTRACDALIACFNAGDTRQSTLTLYVDRALRAQGLLQPQRVAMFITNPEQLTQFLQKQNFPHVSIFRRLARLPERLYTPAVMDEVTRLSQVDEGTKNLLLAAAIGMQGMPATAPLPAFLRPVCSQTLRRVSTILSELALASLNISPVWCRAVLEATLLGWDVANRDMWHEAATQDPQSCIACSEPLGPGATYVEFGPHCGSQCEHDAAHAYCMDDAEGGALHGQRVGFCASGCCALTARHLLTLGVDPTRAAALSVSRLLTALHGFDGLQVCSTPDCVGVTDRSGKLGVTQACGLCEKAYEVKDERIDLDLVKRLIESLRESTAKNGLGLLVECFHCGFIAEKDDKCATIETCPGCSQSRHFRAGPDIHEHTFYDLVPIQGFIPKAGLLRRLGFFKDLAPGPNKEAQIKLCLDDSEAFLVALEARIAKNKDRVVPIAWPTNPYLDSGVYIIPRAGAEPFTGHVASHTADGALLLADSSNDLLWVTNETLAKRRGASVVIAQNRSLYRSTVLSRGATDWDVHSIDLGDVSVPTIDYVRVPGTELWQNKLGQRFAATFDADGRCTEMLLCTGALN